MTRTAKTTPGPASKTKAITKAEPITPKMRKGKVRSVRVIIASLRTKALVHATSQPLPAGLKQTVQWWNRSWLNGLDFNRARHTVGVISRTAVSGELHPHCFHGNPENGLGQAECCPRGPPRWTRPDRDTSRGIDSAHVVPNITEIMAMEFALKRLRADDSSECLRTAGGVSCKSQKPA